MKIFRVIVSRVPPRVLVSTGVASLGVVSYNLGVFGSSSAQDEVKVTDWRLALMKSLPLRSLSRLWGHVNTAYELPTFLRGSVYKTWAFVFGCDLSEIKAESLLEYRNLDEFFTRELKHGCRPIAPDELVSPADSTVLNFGAVEEGMMEQVKGISFSIDALLGMGKHGLDQELMHPNDSIAAAPDVKVKTKLFHIVLYLAPGQLLSVSPTMVRMVNGLFVLNERIVLTGKWPHGFFSMTAVGATNVGSIELEFEKDYFHTNHHLEMGDGTFTEKCLKTGTVKSNKRPEADQHHNSVQNLAENVQQQKNIISGTEVTGLLMEKGGKVGCFHLGSTIVLVFEAPADFQFLVDHNQKVKVGQTLGK